MKIKALLTLFLSISTIALWASDNEELIWVKYDQKTKETRFSDGSRAPEDATPGQYYERKKRKTKKERQWQSPLDIVEKYQPRKIGRVIFSHERHFGAMGEKNCKSCHEGGFSIGKKNYDSKAPSSDLEPHAVDSAGRYCAKCHDGSSKLESVDFKVFTAYGRSNDRSCNRCHAPQDHYEDFTNRHGHVAEKRGNRECAECHRGSMDISRQEQKQAIRFREAQLALIESSSNREAFKATLPNNFCSYCHNSDREAWEKN